MEEPEYPGEPTRDPEYWADDVARYGDDLPESYPEPGLAQYRGDELPAEEREYRELIDEQEQAVRAAEMERPW